MSRLAAVGCASQALDPTWESWPGEAAWTQALENRVGPLRAIQANTSEGLEAIKQVLASTHPLVTRADFGVNYLAYLDGAPAYGIDPDTHVMYAREVDPSAPLQGHGNRHSMAIVGYNDNLEYTHGSGLQKQGAFLLANSEGSHRGTHNSTGYYDTDPNHKGFMWVAYEMFLNNEFGYYDWDEKYLPEGEAVPRGPCFDNETQPTVYTHDDRLNYRPSVYAVARVEYPRRNRLTLTGGIGWTWRPLFTGPMVLEPTEQGAIALGGTVVVDLSDGAHLLVPGVWQQLFVKLVVSDAPGDTVRMTDVTFQVDLDGDGLYDSVPANSVPLAPPCGGGTRTGYAKAMYRPDPVW
jgi:hypothetical protein